MLSQKWGMVKKAETNFLFFCFWPITIEQMELFYSFDSKFQMKIYWFSKTFHFRMANENPNPNFLPLLRVERVCSVRESRSDRPRKVQLGVPMQDPISRARERRGGSERDRNRLRRSGRSRHQSYRQVDRHLAVDD